MTKRKISSWAGVLGRVGYAAKGAVYAVVGMLAGNVALGTGGETTGSKGAIRTIGQQPFGQVMLALLVIGLVCYALWRFLGAFINVQGKGNDAEGIGKRVVYFVTGAIHLSLAYAAFTILRGGRVRGDETAAQSQTAELMNAPFGPWLVIGVGIAIGIAGLAQWRHAYSGSYRRKFDLDGVAASHRGPIECAAKMGLAARGLVFLLIGIFLIQAGWTADASEARGLGGTLSELARQPYGPWLLGLTAFGLFCYGFYCGVIARYGRLATA